MEKVLENINSIISAGDNIVAGISGGADSMILLDLLLKVRQNKPFSLQVLHIEHQIRGDESKSDARFVEEYCKNHDVACTIISEDIPALAKNKKQTLEECARNFRYQQFYKHLKNNGKLFIAHNKNDQAETVLMHIFRGSGISGAAGIKQTDIIYRPLLTKTKAEIIEYAKANNIPFVIDSTNDDTNYTRNYIRNTILPQIEKAYPSAVDAICKFANYAEQCDVLIDSLINPDWLKADGSIDGLAFKANGLVIKRVVEKAYNNCGEYSDLEGKHVQMVIDLVNLCKNGATCNLPHGVIVEKRQNRVYFYKQDNKDDKSYNFCLGANNLPNGKTAMVGYVTEDEVEFGNGSYYVDYYKIPKDAVWRTRKDGDYFARLGSGKKKLNDYFTDKKLPKKDRDNVVVLASGSNVLVVLGGDISENVKIDDGCLQIAKITF